MAEKLQAVKIRKVYPGTTALDGILTVNPEVNIVWAANEGGTHGAVTAVKRLSKAGEAVVFGTDMNKKLADFRCTRRQPEAAEEYREKLKRSSQ